MSANVENKGNRGFLLSCGIDIGTSSTCYAFTFKTSKDKLHLSTILNKNNAHKEKTPTNILTEKGTKGAFVAFGEEAEHKYLDISNKGEKAKYDFYTDYKMILYREENISSTETMAESTTGTKRPLMDLYVMTLEYLLKKFLHQVEIEGHSKISAGEIRWVLCVPATWNERAKDFLREAAVKAGLIDIKHSKQLFILLEATAAALYCMKPGTRFSAIQLETEGAMKPGIKYLVVDAGAGTVDYTAQEALAENRTKELDIATGGDWGGRHIDKKFKDLMIEVLGKERIEGFNSKNPKQWHDFMVDFENAKATVENDKSAISIRLPPDMIQYIFESEKKWMNNIINENTKEHGVESKDGNLIIGPEKVNSLFNSTVLQICSQTEKMTDSGKLKGLDTIYLVGGFGQSKLLQKAMKEQFSDFRFSTPTDARAAVVQGAAMYGINPGIITRVAKKTYGVETYSTFDPKRHAEEKRKLIAGKSFCEELFLPFVQQGEELEPGTLGRMVANPVIASATFINIDFYCIDRPTQPDEVVYVTDQDVVKVGEVRIDMPNTDGGLKREVYLQFAFGDEITVDATDLSTDESRRASFKFDYDTRK